MRSCLVSLCKNRGEIPGVQYFKLTPLRYDAWIKAINRDPNIKLSNSNVVCSDHFTASDYNILTGGLTKGALPTRNLRGRSIASNTNHRDDKIEEMEDKSLDEAETETETLYLNDEEQSLFTISEVMSFSDVTEHETETDASASQMDTNNPTTRIPDSPEGAFSKKAFEILRNKAEKKQCPEICSLLIDEIKLAEPGNVDSSTPKSSLLLVFMVVSMTEDWSIPMGYYHTPNYATCVDLWIVDVLVKLHENGVKIISLTTSALNEHIGFSLAEKLGAKIDGLDDTFTPCFPHPSDGSPINIVYDIPSLTDEMKSFWAVCRTLTDGGHRKIDCHTVFRAKSINLDELETYGEEAFYDWVIIKKRMQFEKRMILKVMADAVQYLMDLNHPEFLCSEGTITFLRVFDYINNFATIKDIMGVQREEPLRIYNEYKWKPVIFKSLDYLKQLKLANNFDGDQRLHTALAGMVVSISSIVQIYSTYVHVGRQLEYILPFRFTLDYFKMFDRQAILEQTSSSKSLSNFIYQLRINIDNIAKHEIARCNKA